MSILSHLDFHGNRVVEFQSVTTPTLKKNNPWGKTTNHSLRKVSSVTSMIGPEGLYSWLVNVARTLTGSPVNADGSVANFHALPASWGEYVRRPDGTSLPYVTYKGAMYLPMSIIASLRHEYRTEDGTPVAKETVAQWLPERQEGQRQELPIERVIRWRKYKVDNLASVRIGKELCEGRAKLVMEKLLAGDDENAEASVVN
jgi:hypothetical protein